MSIPLLGTFVARRTVLRAASWAGLSLAGAASSPDTALCASGEPKAAESELIKRLIGRMPAESPRVQLQMPPIFGNGYGVPLTLTVDSPMTETDFVGSVRVIAPLNPIVSVATFYFSAQNGRAAISTRIRLAESQSVLAIAEMSDGTLLMARKWIQVETNGCL